jgi:pfkB family carbohydrate kinase
MITRLVSLGNVIIDIVAEVQELPERGAEVLASAAALEVGGGFNLMAAAARQGLEVAHAGALGHGPFADLARRAVQAEGIALLLPDAVGEQRDTGFDVVLVDATGERTFVTAVGADAGLTSQRLDHVEIQPSDALAISGYWLLHDANRMRSSSGCPDSRRIPRCVTTLRLVTPFLTWSSMPYAGESTGGAATNGRPCWPRVATTMKRLRSSCWPRCDAAVSWSVWGCRDALWHNADPQSFTCPAYRSRSLIPLAPVMLTWVHSSRGSLRDWMPGLRLGAPTSLLPSQLPGGVRQLHRPTRKPTASRPVVDHRPVRFVTRS